MAEAKEYPKLTPIEYKVLVLVNEKCLVSKETVAHEIWGRQTAVPRAESILDRLWELQLVSNMGQFKQYRYMILEEGMDYLENAVKPLSEFRTA